ncbi:putative inorganic phosphate cotransporter [Photinus pyralis]|uniref:putative inorganic phosphate cotransporter n=1 Tax=Photinus pyralis TaxID=7054 RepID=UPI00126777C6|nr:putative inorganic phosphate cotransporter [Photinus pyralis]
MCVNILACSCGSFVIPQRYVLAFVLTIGVILAYNMRLCFHIAITEITVLESGSNNRTRWTEGGQGIVLASFSAGYLVSYIGALLLMTHTDGKHILGTSFLASAILSCLTPVTVKGASVWGSLAIRVILGCSQGLMYPAIQLLLSEWIPKDSRFRVTSFLHTCPLFAAAVGYACSGYGIWYFKYWETIFYVWGVVGIGWYCIYLVTCYSKPSKHPCITPHEKEFLENNTGPPSIPVPLKVLLNDNSVAPVLVFFFGHALLISTITIELPKFFVGALKCDVNESGMYSSLCFAIICVSCIISNTVADVIIGTNMLGVFQTRKTLACMSTLGSMAFLILGSAMTSTTDVIVCICISMAFIGCWYPGPRVNISDITFKFGSLLICFGEGMASVTGIIVPYVVAILAKQQTLEEWRIIFIILAVIYVVTMIPFLLFGTGERARWDRSSISVQNDHYKGNIWQLSV